MLYKSDFDYFKAYPVKSYSLQRLRSVNQQREIRHIAEESAPSFWEGYCLQSSVHGIKYVAEKDLQMFERVIWAILVALAFVGTVWVCILLSQRFNSAPLATVVESTIYPVSEIPYPGITICNNNRINWLRIEDAKKKFIPNATAQTIDIFERFVQRFEIFEWGSFDEFEEFENVSLTVLDHINLEELLEFMMHRCEEIFEGQCWWRNRYVSCCKNIVKQKSEFGICLAFNSAVNPIGEEREKTESNWPWRTSSFGDWSGLRAHIYLNPASRPPASEEAAGLLVITHNPKEWPNNAQLIPAGTSASVLIQPKLSYAKPTTRRLAPEVRECLFADEADSPQYRSLTLPGLLYLQNNCRGRCRQSYMMSLCNCTVDFLYPTGNYTICKASDFKCLLRYDSIFNYEKPQYPNQYFSNKDDGMYCTCLLECHSIDYKMQITSIRLAEENLTNKIMLDVHFQHGTIIKYRTDVVYGWLDLMVAFGGTAGLFMGSSIISIVEITYYLTIGFGVYLEKRFKKKENSVTKSENLDAKGTIKPAKTKKINVVKLNEISFIHNSLAPIKEKNYF